MKCPVCESSTRILESRLIIDHKVRRRECKSCGFTWCTEEVDSVRGDAELKAWHSDKNKQLYRKRKSKEAKV